MSNMRHLKLLIFISIISGNLNIDCKDKREYAVFGSFISIPYHNKNKSVSCNSSNSTSSERHRSNKHDPYAVLGNRTRSIDDYNSKQTNKAYSTYAQALSCQREPLNYLEKIEYKRLEKLYGNNLKKYDITYKCNDAPATYQELFGPNSTLTLKPKDQLTQQANEEARFIRNSINYYELGLDDKFNTSSICLDFAECGLFYKPESDITIKAWEWYGPNWVTKYLFSDKKIFSMFTNFYNYSAQEYINDLRLFPCFDRFMQEFAKQIETNPEFKNALQDMDNGYKIIDFIKNEANRINKIGQHNKQILDQHNKKIFQSLPIFKDLKNIEQLFENELKQNPNHKIDWQENINVLEKTLKDPVAFNDKYNFSKNGISILDYLKINKTYLTSFTGNHLQHHFHKKAVDTINTSAEVWANSVNPEVRNFLEVAVTFAVKCTELNRFGQLFGAANCINAATDLLTGAVLRCKEIPQNILNFKAHPFDTIINKCDDIAVATYNIITSTTKACKFLLANVPASHGIPTPSELKKLDNIDRKAQELQQVWDHINTYLENTPRTEKLQSLGYFATSTILDVATTTAGFKVLSTLKGSALKAALNVHGKTLKKLGPIGDEVAKLTGLAIDKGVKATESVLDVVRHQPELVTAEGGVFKFVENTLNTEIQFLQSFNNLDKKKVIMTAKNGLQIKGFTFHGIDRAIGDTYKRMGVKPHAIIDALRNPLKISGIEVDKLGRKAQKFYGKVARVVVNPDNGLIISVNPLSTKKLSSKL